MIDGIFIGTAGLAVGWFAHRWLAKKKRFAVFTVGPFKQKGQIMNIVITDSQQVALSVTFQDAKGNPATPDNPPVWAVSDATLLTSTPSADGLSTVIAAVGPEGTAQVTLTETPNTGSPIIGVATVQIVGGAAVTAVISAAAPTEQTPATPPVTPPAAAPGA